MLSDGFCYDRAPLITLGFGDDDFKVIDADIDDLRLNPEFIDKYRAGNLSESFPNHCFAERTRDDGTTWVYDTSNGFVYERSLYYKIQKPKITKINNKKQTLEYLYNDSQGDSDIEKQKEVLPLILPIIESHMTPIQSFYLAQLKEEIKNFKKEIDYDKISKEFMADMKVKGFIISPNI